MSRGEGWWLASDLKWYPPESAEDVDPPAAPSIPGSTPGRKPDPPASQSGTLPSGPPPTDPPPEAGEKNGQNSRRSRQLLAAGLALALVLAGGGTVLALRSSGHPSPRGAADLPFTGDTAGGPVDTKPAPPSNVTVRPSHLTTASHPSAATASHPSTATASHPSAATASHICCRVPDVVGEQFLNGESDVYSADLTPVDLYGTAAECAGVTVPNRSFVIGQQGPVQGSVLPAGGPVVLFFCDGANRG